MTISKSVQMDAYQMSEDALDKVIRMDYSGERWLEAQLARMCYSGKFAEFVTVTPEMAAALLMKNPNNRHIVSGGVKEWANALKRGEWKQNGEPIIVSDSGELNDGQHRLTAVVETGISMPTLVVFGVERDSRKTVDTGRKRTVGHVLGMAGVTNSALVAATIRSLINFEKKAHIATHRTGAEVEEYYLNNTEVHDSLAIGRAAATPYHQPHGMICALHYMMHKRNPGRAYEFFKMLSDGIVPNINHPAARLRVRLLDNVAAKNKLKRMEIAALIIKAWNLYCEDKTVKNLSWRSGGDAPEPFPIVR